MGFSGIPKLTYIEGGLFMADFKNKDNQGEKTMTNKDNETKNIKLSSNDLSENKNENTETVVTQPRINTEGL